MRDYFLCFLTLAVFGVYADASEWDCASTSGTFERSTDCTMGDEVAVSGDLTVTGKETVYSTLTAASNKRHFKIISGAPRVSLKWLNLTGGDTTSNSGDDRHGGSIHVYNVAAHLNISHCVFFNNSAHRGGAISAEGGQSNVLFSYLTFNQNRADYGGGGVFLEKGKLVAGDSRRG